MATINKYIDPDVIGGDGDGTSFANAYSSMNAWEAAEQTDLDTANDIHIANCRASLGGADTTAVNLLGWTTSAADYLMLLGNQSTGIYDTSEYHLTNTNASLLSINEDYVRVEALQLEVTQTTVISRGIQVQVTASGANDIRVGKCIVKGVCSGTQSGFGITARNSDSIVTVENTVVHDFLSGGSNAYRAFDLRCATALILNCTAYGNGFSIVEEGSGTYTLKNSVSFGNNDDLHGTWAVTYSCGDDADFSAGTGNFQITQTADNYAALVVDAAGGDFSGTDASSELYNAGTNTGAPSDDIIGTSRPQATTVDIGAFELIAGAPAGRPLPQRVLSGPFAGPLSGPL